MKSTLRLFWLLACLLALRTPAATTTTRLPRLNILGRDYVRLDDWARMQGGQLRWLVPRQEVKVMFPSGTLTFNVDSRKATVKGTCVWLSWPVAYKNGAAYLAAIDLPTTLHPLLTPPRELTSRTLETIVLDPGHGGRDPGNQEGRRQEKQYTLSFARELAELLTRAGFKVSLTRNSDSFIDLPIRPDIARRRKADLFLSLHFNSADGAGGASVKGTEVFCMTPVRASSTHANGEGAGAGAFPGNRFDSRNVLLAYQLQKAITGKTGTEDRGVKRARFAVLRAAEMPAVLIEAAFMTHPTDSTRIYDPAQRRVLAQSIVDGVLAYRNLIQRK